MERDPPVDPLLCEILRVFNSRREDSVPKLREIMTTAIGNYANSPDYRNLSSRPMLEGKKYGDDISEMRKRRATSITDGREKLAKVEPPASVPVPDGQSSQRQTVVAPVVSKEERRRCSACTDTDALSNLTECQKCRSFYHALCHDPPITSTVRSELAANPRFRWLCAKCVKVAARKHIVTQGLGGAASRPALGSTGLHKSPSAPQITKLSTQTLQTQQPQKTSQFSLKQPQPQPRMSSSKKPGLVTAAVRPVDSVHSAKPHTSTSTSSSSFVRRPAAPSVPSARAEDSRLKILENFKKRAALQHKK